ncbi:energy-coupling factor transporter transmembrane component T family protein [Peptostreptococcus faecalis]|uniref:energy-coupling factor transporter transmembrane component T family protein n=1 Tax=Peptostreptococcus faecalis TaxID=2045015 RepID=UPI000C7E5C5F|nr:energy-coupling factor transporter transmembrane component T [Peptostreptococcus faecalis]
MLKDITLGQYYPVKSIVHSLDARTKLFATVIFMASIFVINQFWAYAVAFAFMFLISKVSNIPASYLVKGVKPLRWIILFTFIINIFFVQGGEILLQFGILKISELGLRTAFFMAIRLILLVVVTSILTLTTSPIELTDGIENICSPLKKFGFPAHELAMMMTIALRFIPTLLDETDKIMKAQMSRGADFESKNIISRAKNMVPLLIPLFVSAFRRADELSMAMEARCYRGGENRTKMKQSKLGKSDYITDIVVVLFLGFTIASRFIKLI